MQTHTARACAGAARPTSRMQQLCIRRAPAQRLAVATAAAYRTVDVEQGKVLLDKESYMFLDVRSVKEYDAEHLTKPPRCTLNVPIKLRNSDAQDPNFVAAVSSKAAKSAKLLVACADGGSASQAAAEALAAAGFSEALLVAGGYNAWRQVFSTCGRRRPAGRWMPTGKEALKSGLPIPGVADRYEDVNPV